MDERQVRASSGTVEGVRRRLNAWRRTRSRGRIPEALWQAAVDLARAQGASSVAEALRLDGESLNRRLEACGEEDPQRGRSSSPTFVEVELPGAEAGGECVVELEDRTGTRLTIRLPPSQAEHVVAVAGALWGCR